jgi:hypothetical protein
MVARDLKPMESSMQLPDRAEDFSLSQYHLLILQQRDHHHQEMLTLGGQMIRALNDIAAELRRTNRSRS